MSSTAHTSIVSTRFDGVGQVHHFLTVRSKLSEDDCDRTSCNFWFRLPFGKVKRPQGAVRGPSFSQQKESNGRRRWPMLLFLERTSIAPGGPKQKSSSHIEVRMAAVPPKNKNQMVGSASVSLQRVVRKCCGRFVGF